MSEIDRSQSRANIRVNSCRNSLQQDPTGSGDWSLNPLTIHENPSMVQKLLNKEDKNIDGGTA
jgi:hypothetical protein